MARRALIVGLGLMGGSLGLALRRLEGPYHVVGYDRNSSVVSRALACGAIDAPAPVSGEVPDPRGCDLVVVATPVCAVAPLIIALAARCEPGAVLTDLGSTKAQIHRDVADQLPTTVAYVGSHPMAGSEIEGLDGARFDLYRGAVWVLTPPAARDTSGGRRLEQVVLDLGARPLWLEPDDHDHRVAQVSHLPYVAAVALTLAAARPGASGEAALELAAGGFADTTRVAACPVSVFADILLANRDNVLASMEALSSEIEGLRRALVTEDRDALCRRLERARTIRQALRRPDPGTS